jgi:hypothetical protein
MSRRKGKVLNVTGYCRDSQPMASGPNSAHCIFVNTVFLEESHTQLFIYFLQLFHTPQAVEYCDRNFTGS